jgi:hypothetical protein
MIQYYRKEIYRILADNDPCDNGTFDISAMYYSCLFCSVSDPDPHGSAKICLLDLVRIQLHIC